MNKKAIVTVAAWAMQIFLIFRRKIIININFNYKYFFADSGIKYEF